MGDALHTHGGVTSALEARLADAGLLAAQGPTPLDVRTGVLHGPGTTQLVTGTAATAPMQVAVAAHQWVTSRGAANGPYRGSLDAVQLVTIAAAPASGSRIDVVYVKQQDAQPGIPTPDAVTAPLYGVVQGVDTTGTPSKPQLPLGAEELATVRVDAGAVATNGAGITITNTARQTVPRGVPVPVRSQAERDDLSTWPGRGVLRLDTAPPRVETWTGSEWDWPGRWQTYTPALTNLTLGNGTRAGRFSRVGNTVSFSVIVTAGSTTSITGLLEVGLPVPAAAVGHVQGAGFRSAPNGAIVWRANGASAVFVYDAATGASWQAGTAFDAGDTLRISGTYEAA